MNLVYMYKNILLKLFIFFLTEIILPELVMPSSLALPCYCVHSEAAALGLLIHVEG